MSEILNRIDFAGRARFQFYDAFFRPYHFDTYGPKKILFYVFLWNHAGPYGYGSYDNTQLGPPARLVKGYYGTRAFQKEKIHCLCPFPWKKKYPIIYLNIITTSC